MKGKKTSQEVVNQIDLLRKNHPPTEIIRLMQGSVSRRTVYRIFRRLREKDVQKVREDAKAIVEERQREIRERLEANPVPKVERYKRTAQFPANLRRVRSF